MPTIHLLPWSLASARRAAIAPASAVISRHTILPNKDQYLYKLSLYIHANRCENYMRPHYHDSTISRPICEVKHGQVWLVLAWGTSWEVQMLHIFFVFFFGVLLRTRTRSTPLIRDLQAALRGGNSGVAGILFHRREGSSGDLLFWGAIYLVGS